MALCKYISSQFEEVPVTPGNVKCCAVWRMEHFRGRSKDLLAISRIVFSYCTLACCGKQHAPNRYHSAGLEP